MITLIFLDDNKSPVNLTFRHNLTLNDAYVYGVWFIDNNNIHLNDNGWDILMNNRKDIRKLKPMLSKLYKITDIGALRAAGLSVTSPRTCGLSTAIPNA